MKAEELIEELKRIKEELMQQPMMVHTGYDKRAEEKIDRLIEELKDVDEKERAE